MIHETTIQHKFRPGTPVYVFNSANAIIKTKVEEVKIKITFNKRTSTSYNVGQVIPYAEDQVYGTVDEVLQAQREILERSE
jgi:hypothetical protein